jgi:hypothetical protein
MSWDTKMISDVDVWDILNAGRGRREEGTRRGNRGEKKVLGMETILGSIMTINNEVTSLRILDLPCRV